MDIREVDALDHIPSAMSIRLLCDGAVFPPYISHLTAQFWHWHDSCTIRCAHSAHAYRLKPEDAEVVRAFMVAAGI